MNLLSAEVLSCVEKVSVGKVKDVVKGFVEGIVSNCVVDVCVILVVFLVIDFVVVVFSPDNITSIF